MLTRRQKRSLTGFIAVLSCCVLASAVLVYLEISEGINPEPVVFSDILDGAIVSADEDDIHQDNDFTYNEAEMYESMYSDEIISFSADTTPVYEYYAEGAGGTLLIKTTPTGEITTETEKPFITTSPPQTTTAPYRTTTKKTTAATTVKTTKKPVTTTTKKPAKTTTAKKTTTTTSKTPFINVGGGKPYEGDEFYLRLLTLVNQARKANGVKELWYSARVHEVCELRAEELSSYYSHNRPDGTKFCTAFNELGIKYKVCGENIAYGRNMFKTPEDVFEAWMKSDSHRENILYPDYECCAFGLSILKVGKDTYYYWTQEFARLS